MLVLGIETSTPVTSVALWSDEPLVSLRVAKPRGHLEFLVPAIEDLFARGGVSVRDLTGVAVGLGPGLFTSMRVGIATAKTMAHTLDLPAVGVSSLDLLAFAARHTSRLICASIDARRGEVFAAFYRAAGDRILRQSEYAAMSPAQLATECVARDEDVLFTGNGALVYEAQLRGVGAAEFAPDRARFPSADALCEIALPLFAGGATVPAAKLEPLYVRKTDAEIKWEQRGVQIERPFRVKVPKRASQS